MVSVLLVCQPGLVQKSLSTAISAIPLAMIIAKATDAESALHLVHQLNPEVLLVDANSFHDAALALLKRAKELAPKMICVVLMAAVGSVHKTRFSQEGADFVLDDRDLDREFSRILRDIQAHSAN